MNGLIRLYMAGVAILLVYSEARYGYVSIPTTALAGAALVVAAAPIDDSTRADGFWRMVLLGCAGTVSAVVAYLSRDYWASPGTPGGFDGVWLILLMMAAWMRVWPLVGRKRGSARRL